MVTEKKATPAKITTSSLQIQMYDLSGSKKTALKVSKDVFGKKVNDQLLSQYMRVYLTNQRQGNASTKTRSDVIGSTRKIYRQKGTGRARHGAKTAPIFVGGGVAFGPKSKDYSLKMNKKQKKVAFFGALSKALEQNNVIGLTDEALKTKPKTKEVVSFLKKLDFKTKKTLLVLSKLEGNNLVLAARNIANMELADVRSLNPYQILKQEKIIFLKDALEVLEKHFLSKNEN